MYKDVYALSLVTGQLTCARTEYIFALRLTHLRTKQTLCFETFSSQNEVRSCEVSLKIW
jgi:hypothetical protein